MKLKPEIVQRLKLYLPDTQVNEVVSIVEEIADSFKDANETVLVFKNRHDDEFVFRLKDFEGEKMIETNHDLGHAPKHYEQACAKIEPRELLKMLPFQLGNACKYILRYPFKGQAVADLKKALDYLEWAGDNDEHPIDANFYILVPYFDNEILNILFGVFEDDYGVHYKEAVERINEIIRKEESHED